MASIIRWLHLSDFHVGKDNYATRKMFTYIIKHISERMETGIIPDLIFVTGDLANSGKYSEYETFWLELISPIQDVIGNDIASRTFVVPGNHDVDREFNQAFDRAEMSSASSRYFDPTEEGRKLREMLMPRFRSFSDADFTSQKGFLGCTAGSFSTVLNLSGRKVGIAGINTAWLSKDATDERTLTPGKPLLEHALDDLKEAELRVVLGHHPIDWMMPSEQKMIKSLLGNHCALYLHGHLHESWAEPAYGGGHQFLTIQTGAGFQEREGEPWRNGLLWGEADLTSQELRLQPMRWTPDHQGWTLAADAFPENQRRGDNWIYPLPGTDLARKSAATAKIPQAQPPKGWEIVAPSALLKCNAPLRDETAIGFFNGAVPGWEIALSRSIPRREIVQTLEAHFREANAADRPIIAHLLAAGCEGKTTALLQAACAVVHDNDEWRILRRNDDAEPLNPIDILPVLNQLHRWLIVIDESDRAIGGVFGLLGQLPGELKGRVHFLMACRDSDWNSSGGHNQDWSSVATYNEDRLSGLSEKDAAAIIAAWAAFGKRGLGDLFSVPEGERSEVLGKQAREEAKTLQGAFFGALLAVRQGKDLSNHARLMLERLGQRKIRSGGTLRDALALIAIMHSEEQEFLSRPVLAQALNCPIAKLNRDVIVPLGQEAAATTTSSFIFTRHRRIAQAIVSVLENDFAHDFADSLVSLGVAAIDAYANGSSVPELAKWRYGYPGHFFDTGRKELALNISRGVLSREPDNVMTLVNTSMLYRKADLPEKAVELFRKFPRTNDRDRAFYTEWATAEGECNDPVGSAMLAAFSLSDECQQLRINNDSALRGLACLGVSFGKLFRSYHELSFRNALAAVAVLGQQLRPVEPTARYFSEYLIEAKTAGAQLPNVDQAFEMLVSGVAGTKAIGVNEVLAKFVPDSSNYHFIGLNRLISSSILSKERSVGGK